MYALRFLFPVLAIGASCTLVAGCGLPPCMEGSIHVEVGPLQDGGTCLWEMWPQGASFDAKDVGNREHSGDRCDLRELDLLELPEGAESGGAIVSGEAEVPGYAVAHISPVNFPHDGCAISVSGDLMVDKKYEDFDAALAAQGAGDDHAFYLYMSYESYGDCPEYPFPQTMWQRFCGNVYQASVSRL